MRTARILPGNVSRSFNWTGIRLDVIFQGFAWFRLHVRGYETLREGDVHVVAC
jgi:hypothetical protein